MWKYIGAGRSITGAAAEDMTDEDFTAAEAWLDAQFEGVKGSLSTCQHAGQLDDVGKGKPVALEAGHACLLYEHVDEKARPPARAAAPTAPSAPAAPAAPAEREG